MREIDVMKENFKKINLNVTGLNYPGTYYCIHLGSDAKFARKLADEIRNLAKTSDAGEAAQEDNYGMWEVTGETKYAPIVWKAAHHVLNGQKYRKP